MTDLSQVDVVFSIVTKLFREGSAYEGDARAKAVWHRDNFTHFLRHQDHLVRPVTLEYWPSLTCTARCALCPYRRNKARQDADQSSARIMTTLDIARRIAQVSEFGAKSVLLTGGGEPFVNPEIDEIARIMRESGLKLGVYTNGTVPERDRQIRNIIALEPQFVRISVNAGSAEEHDREYHIEPYQGTSAWEMLQRNALTFLDAISRQGVKTTLGFSFIMLGNERPDSYRGMAEFVRNIHRASGEKPVFAHFRPKLTYYRADGSVVDHMSRKLVDGISRIPERVDRYVMPHVASSPGITIQTNTYASKMIADARPTRCFCTGWCTSFDHLGQGYIISELCGTPWDGAKWGDLRIQSMQEAWFSPTRLQIHQNYATGAKKVPLYNKLTGIQGLLWTIREAAPEPFSDAEVRQFWERFDGANLTRPRSWDFI